MQTIEANTESNHSTILFDGVCNLCNGFVQFIIHRDKQAHFIFGSLQSEPSKVLLQRHNLTNAKLASVILIENNKVFTQSTAALKIVRQLPRWKLFYAFIIVPSFIRDGIYKFIAKNRYRFFGKKETCMIPTPELKHRFIE